MKIYIDTMNSLVLFLIILSNIFAHQGIAYSDGHSGDCDFNNGLCDYIRDPTSNFDWTLHAGSTPSYFTGPEHDHSTGKTGKYVFIESSNPRLNGDRARLISKNWLQPISLTSRTCLRFYYHMYGHTMGSVRVYLRYVEMDKPIIIWSLDGNQGQGWSEARVPLNAIKPFKVIFEGETSYSYLGDAAIDDITYYSGPTCHIWPPHAVPSDRTSTIIPIPNPPKQNSCGLKPFQRSSRIIGGVPSNPGEWPWHAMLFRFYNITNKKPVCGGTLIMSSWVITAAHCVADIIDKNNYQVRLGAYKRITLQGPEQELKIRNIYVHPEFNTVTRFNNDVALIRLDRPAILSKERRTGLACLPSGLLNLLPDTLCWVTGYGRLWNNGPHPDVLLQGQLPVVSNTECSHMESYPGRITDSMFCAGYTDGGIDTCQGDSGGPFVCDVGGKWYLAGITSWGDGCGKPRKYGVYANVTHLENWILNVITFPDQHRKAN